MNSRIIAFRGVSFFLTILKTSKPSNFILHQFRGLHNLWDTPKVLINLGAVTKRGPIDLSLLFNIPLSNRALPVWLSQIQYQRQ